ncbi:hypothetical protein NliqN6_0038 [Naganishia liquefaciens]|uniref:NADP-dependent oxidoreductase domain-containing protein n=1 Tax=Naganishia liquefaciens TaxID=104408 RepID=A0A8H3YDB7_9TREE|nr:hypothetical protein NliqN6_0038 [Naganishia liquefaciens]
MPFTSVKLNDGRHIPAIGFGTWKIPQDVAGDQTQQAIEVGFDHIDTAQVYRNEVEAGQGIRDSGLKREQLWITTKWSGVDDKPVRQSCLESLDKLGIEYLDLYLIHSPRLCKGDIAGTWAEFEKLKKEGLVKSIGVSNFTVKDLETLLKTANIKPVVNQILLHPYVIHQQTPLLEYMHEQNIAPEGYSSLIPLTSRQGGPVDKPVAEIGKRLKVEPEQVLLAWSRAKGAIVITTSSRKDRLERYLAVGDITLTDQDVEAIDKAGRKGERDEKRKTQMVRGVKWAALGGVGLWALARLL